MQSSINATSTSTSRFSRARDLLAAENHPPYRPPIDVLKEETANLFSLFFTRVVQGESLRIQDVFKSGARRIGATIFVMPHLFIGWCGCSAFPSDTRVHIARHLVEKLQSDTEVGAKIEETGKLDILTFGSGFGLQSLLELFLILEKYKDHLQTLSITFVDKHYAPFDPTQQPSQFNRMHVESSYHIALVLNELEERYQIRIEGKFVHDLESFIDDHPDTTYDLISSVDVLFDGNIPKGTSLSRADVPPRNIPTCLSTLRKIVATSPHARFFTSFTDPCEEDTCLSTSLLRRFNEGIRPELIEATRTTLFFGKLPVGLHLLDMYFPKNDRIVEEEESSAEPMIEDEIVQIERPPSSLPQDDGPKVILDRATRSID